MDLSAAVWAGVIATTLTIPVLWVFYSLGGIRFPPTAAVGGIFLRDPRTPWADTLGLLTLYIAGGLVLPMLYAWILQAAFADISALLGAALGAIHGILAVAFLPLVGMISASVRQGDAMPPGRLGLEWGWGTPVGILTGHVLYGALLGAILAGFARDAMAVPGY